MPRRFPVLMVCFAALGLGGLIAGCSSSGGTGATSPSAPTPTPSPTSSVSSQYNTLGNISCTAPNDAIPGYYVQVITNGVVSGSTYTATGQGFNGYQMEDYGTPGASPAPTVPPLVPVTPSPSASPNALGILYYGEYSVPAFTDELDESTPIDATTGCFQLETVQAIGPSPAPSPVGGGFGYPNFPAPYPAEVTYVGAPGAGSFSVTTFTITNLTRTTGSGTFTFPVNGNPQTVVTGTVTITGSTSFPTTQSEESTSVRRTPQFRLH